MNQGPGNRKRRPRSPTGGNKKSSEGQSAAEHQALAAHDREEDASTFWSRSNARLNIDPADGTPAKRNALVGGEYPCAACGTVSFIERTPKHRHEVMCDACRSALGGLIVGAERDAAGQLRRAMNPNRNRKNEGIPQFDAEDLQALAEVRARAELGSGRNANRRKGNGPLFSTGAGGLRTGGPSGGQGGGGGGPGGGRGGRGGRTARGNSQGGGNGGGQRSGKGRGDGQQGKSRGDGQQGNSRGDGQQGNHRGDGQQGNHRGDGQQGNTRSEASGGEGTRQRKRRRPVSDERGAAPRNADDRGPSPGGEADGGDSEARRRRRRRRRRPGEGGDEQGGNRRGAPTGGEPG